MDEEAYTNALFRIRWPHGFSCARCGYTRYYPVSGRDQYGCALCGRQFSLTSGTFMHKSRLPLHTWFEAAALYNADPPYFSRRSGPEAGTDKTGSMARPEKIRLGLTTRKGQ